MLGLLIGIRGHRMLWSVTSPLGADTRPVRRCRAESRSFTASQTPAGRTPPRRDDCLG
jgi:hypothetical protein